MAKDFGVSYGISILFLVFDANPKVPRHNRAVRADSELPKFDLSLAVIQHAGMHETNIGYTPEFFIVIIHCLLDFYA